MAKRSRRKVERGTVYRPYFTTRNGKRIYASDYGHKSWPIRQG